MGSAGTGHKWEWKVWDLGGIGIDSYQTGTESCGTGMAMGNIVAEMGWDQ